MLQAIKHGLRGLATFHGRDARQAFWYYVLFAYLVTTAITMVTIVPMMIRSFVVGIQQGVAAAQSGDPAAAERATQLAMADTMGRSMELTVWVSMIASLLLVLLLAAALVRRLHDSGLPGYWAVVPAALQLTAIALMPGLYADMIADMQAGAVQNPFAGMSAMFGGASLLSYAAIGVTVLLGVRKSTPGPNRYGDAPFVA